MKTENLTNKPFTTETKMRLNRVCLGTALRSLIASSVSDDEVLAALQRREIPHYKINPLDPDSYPMDQV